MMCCEIPNLVVGIVPDFVTRVRFDGHDIPIVNSAFAFSKGDGPIPQMVVVRASG